MFKQVNSKLILVIFFIAAGMIIPASCETELVQNGGFETGTLEGWTMESGTIPWFNEEPHGATVYGEVPYEGDWRVYMNPNDHGNPSLSQKIMINNPFFRVRFAVLPHSSYSPGDQNHPRIIMITAYGDDDQPIMDSSDQIVELTYVLVGSYPSEGYQLEYNLPLKDPNEGLSAWEYFDRDFIVDYIDAGGNPLDFEGTSYFVLKFQALDGGGGTSWDAFSIESYQRPDFVIPETPFGTITAFLAMIFAYVLFVFRRN